MPTTVHETLEQFERKASAAYEGYHRAVREGVSRREARRAHDQARQQSFIDLMAQIRERQAELAGYLDESTWTSLEDARRAPDYRAELENAHELSRGFGARSGWAACGTWAQDPSSRPAGAAPTPP